MELPHREFVSLRCRGGDAHPSLLHALTGECLVCVPLATIVERFSAWSLHFTDEGWGYISTGAESVWVAQMFQMSAHKATNGTIFVQHKGGEKIWLADLLSKYTVLKFDLQATRTTFTLDMQAFEVAWNGAQVWVNLLSFHAGLMIKTSTASVPWLSKRWPSWVRACRELGLGVAHLRKPVARQDVDEKEDEIYHGVSTRSLQFHGASVAATIALLAIWAACRVRCLSQPHPRALSEEVLAHLLGAWLPDHFEVDIVVNPSMHISAGYAEDLRLQDGALRVAIDEKSMALTALVDASSGSTQTKLRKWLLHLPPDRRVSLCKLLMGCAYEGRSMSWLFSQLVVQLAEIIEQRLVLRAEIIENLRRVGHRKRARIGHDPDWRRDCHIITSYIGNANKRMRNAADLSLAVDASVLGNRNTLLGCVCDPVSGVACWSFPQASRNSLSQ